MNDKVLSERVWSTLAFWGEAVTLAIFMIGGLALAFAWLARIGLLPTLRM